MDEGGDDLGLPAEAGASRLVGPVAGQVLGSDKGPVGVPGKDDGPDPPRPSTPGTW